MQTQPRQAPKREGCKEAILALLEQHGGEMPSNELIDELKQAGYSIATVRRVRDGMKQEGMLRLFPKGQCGNRQWFIALAAHFQEQPHLK
ncbi:hypothetical protein ODJ80_01905 [Acutalibacter sp. LFL-21]|uniref:hypothetical protein n=1 Tax=Acutalibacter sp. LFL-21 TaxID=2983399 RepID=UPI0021D695C0|nr:hypothetical protein [Acutalibacter sp. LFL-21]MCU7651571.1 hypothetical protein [Acutalibacter sp. LFL-21]